MVDTEAEDIVEAIAARYLEIGCSVMTPNTKRIGLIERLIREYRIDGIVEIDLQACTPYTVEAYTIRQLALMVTHDVDEAIYMGSRVIVMDANPGRIIADIRIEEDFPRNRSSQGFIAYRNMILNRLHFAGEK